MRQIALTIVMLVLAATSARAEVPAEAADPTAYLMREPVTLWDWGLHRLNHVMEEWMEHNTFGIYVGSVFPSHEKPNQLVVSLSSVELWDESDIRWRVLRKQGRGGAAGDPKVQCGETVRIIREAFGIDGVTGERLQRYGGPWGTRFSTYFLHEGFERTNQPKGLADQIDAMVVIKVFVRDDRLEKTAMCQGMLTGKSVWFEEMTELESQGSGTQGERDE